MRTLTFAAGLAALLLVGTIVKQEAVGADLYQPKSMRQAAFEYDNYLYFAQEDEAGKSPSDAPVPKVEEAPPADDGGVSYCEPECGGSCGRCRSCCCLGDPWTLPVPCCMQSHNIGWGGWISAGYYPNAWGAPDNGPLGFNNIGNAFTMNQLWGWVGKAADTGGCGFDWGARIDYVFGADGPDTQAFGDGGWDFGWNSSDEYGSAIPQLYVEAAFNDLTVKMGHFYTIIGWEVVQAPDNFFYSHSYTMYYGEPFTHTGALASYAINDVVTAHGGWTMGWDSGFDNLNDGSVFLGGLSFDLSDDTSLSWAVTAGDLGFGLGNIYMNSFVLRFGLTEKLTYILQHDLGGNTDLGAGDNEWYGINQYVQYAFNESWAAGIRFEWFRDDDGTRVVINDVNGLGNAGDYYEVTLGVNYRPHANVIIRPEIRWDWYEGTLDSGGGPFDAGRRNEQFAGGFDFIVTF